MQSWLRWLYRFKMALLSYFVLEMEKSADTEEKEMDESCLEDCFSAFINIGDVPLVGELTIAQRIPENVLNVGTVTMMKQVKKE